MEGWRQQWEPWRDGGDLLEEVAGQVWRHRAEWVPTLGGHEEPYW